MATFWRQVERPEDVDKRVHIWTPAAREPGRTVWRLHAEVEWRCEPNLPGESITTLLTRYGPALQPAAGDEHTGWSAPGETVLEAIEHEPSDYEIRHAALDAVTRYAAGHSDPDDVVQAARAFEAFLRSDAPEERS